jgi:hypothetical protein
MRSINRSVVLLLLFTLNACAAARSSYLQTDYDKRLERLKNEQQKLVRQTSQTDPVGRTKTQIKIAEILLTLVSDAVQSGEPVVMERRLGEYTAAIQDAHQTMMKTGRDAHRKPGGFKDLEIALRRHVRQLEDIGKGLSFDEREPVEKAIEQAADIRDNLLKALFGEQNAPARKS